MALQRTQISPDRDIFAYDARRAARIVWALLTLTQAISLIRQGPQLRSWQVIAISLYAASLALSLFFEYTTQSTLSFLPSLAAHQFLPIIFGNNSQSPWVSYGLITVVSIVYLNVIDNSKVVVTGVLGLVGLLYLVSKLNLGAISDNVDNSLLNGYFSTSWCLIVGIGALVIKQSYLKYSNAIESTISKIYQLQTLEKAKLTQLNLRDFENSQLHGTILNTLIAVRNAPHLIANRVLVSEYLHKDLALLRQDSDQGRLNTASLLSDISSLPFQREMQVTLEVEPHLNLTPELETLIREILREMVLNTKKHTSASSCHIKIFAVEYMSNELVDGDLLDRNIVIESIDNSPVFSEVSPEMLEEESKKSVSLARLIRNVQGSLEIFAEDSLVTRRAILPMPSDGKHYVDRIIKLRSEAIKFVGIGYISLSFFFGTIAFPGYLYLGISREVTYLLLAHFLFTGTALIFRRKSAILAGLGAACAIATFPILSLGQNSCSDIQYLPWLFNSIIGSVFLSSMLINHRILRWIPALVFYIASNQISAQLPPACSHLLDGSTPGIVLISLVAIGISYARKRDLTYEERFISSAQKEFARIDTFYDTVISEREKLIARIEQFADSLDEGQSNQDLTEEISTLILEIRAFLLLSEYLDEPLVQALHTFIQARFESGYRTHLEINCSEFPFSIKEKEMARAIKEMKKWAQSRTIRIALSRTEDLLILQASLEPDQSSEESESRHHEDDLSFHFAF